MPDTDEFEIQLIDGFNDAILGCIYEDDGTEAYSVALHIWAK